MFNTESEAWEAIADTLEMIEGMPSYKYGGGQADGLCAVLYMMWHDGQIDENLHDKMSGRVQRTLRRAKWLAIKGEWKPRVTIARRFAKEARNSS